MAPPNPPPESDVLEEERLNPIDLETRIEAHRHAKLSKPVFFITASLIVAFTIWAWLAPTAAQTVIFGVRDWIAHYLGWYYILTAGIIVVFVLIVAFTRAGKTKLGPDHSKPKYNMFTWAAMLFAAGIGVDLMFFGISGPASNLLTPPEGSSVSPEAARMAPLWTMFWYGIPGWAMYALMGAALGLFAYRYHLPLSIRSALAPIIGKRISGPAGHAVQIAATLGTIFGISVSLGIGVVFLNFGLTLMIPAIPHSLATQIWLLVVAVAITTISTVSGVDKGIRRLSELNVLLAIVLMVWVLFSGKTVELLNQLVLNVGDFFSKFPGMMLNTFGYSADADTEAWLADWTLFFWAWWIAWACFVGLFLARISRGRTLRQFILGTLLIPFTFILLWVSIFGNAALSFFMSGHSGFLDEAVNQPESGFYTLLQQYPGATFTIGLAVVTGLLFYVTSADSGSMVMANMTSQSTVKDSDGAPWLRIVWAFITGALTLAMLFVNGVETTQAATVVIGLPFSVVMYLIMYSLYKVLRSEHFVTRSKESSMSSVLSSRVKDGSSRGSWRNRLRQKMTFPSAMQLKRYVNTVAAPAVEDVAEELRELDQRVECHRGKHPDYGLPYVNLLVHFPNHDEFKYQLYPVAYPIPRFARNQASAQDVFFKLEVFSLTGSQGQDTMGYTQDQIISDVLDAYDAHMAFLDLTGDKGAPTSVVDVEIPEEWIGTDEVDPQTDALQQVAAAEREAAAADADADAAADAEEASSGPATDQTQNVDPEQGEK